jgi:hypothetical protein
MLEGSVNKPRATDELITSLSLIIAIIIFQVVYSPAGPRICVHCLISQTARIACTRILSGIRIHAKAQSEGVHVVRHRSNAARKLLRVGDEGIVVRGVTSGAPTVIEDHIVVP